MLLVKGAPVEEDSDVFEALLHLMIPECGLEGLAYRHEVVRMRVWMRNRQPRVTDRNDGHDLRLHLSSGCDPLECLATRVYLSKTLMRHLRLWW